MRKRIKKTLILSLKFALAVALLGWVLTRVSWNDFVLGADGKTSIAVHSVTETPDGLRLELPDGSSVVRAAETLSPVDPDGPADASNYERPGFFSAIRGIRYPLLAVGMTAFLLVLIGCAHRWRGLIAVQGTRIGVGQAVRLTWLGAFFNSIVLGTTGGDLVKAYYLTRQLPSRTVCLVTVVADRVIGLTGLALLSAMMLIIVWAGRGYFDPSGVHTEQLTNATIGVGAVLIGLTGAALFLGSPKLRRLLHVEALYQRLPIAAQIASAGEALHKYASHPVALGRAMAWTLGVHLCFVGGIGLLGASLNVSIPWFGYLIFLPLIYIIAAVPIVPGGVGLAESLYVAFFAAWATESEILALALLARLAPIFWSLPGAIVAMSGAKPESAAEAAAPAENCG